MSGEIVFERQNRWLPRVERDGGELRLEIVGGADALHEPRTFGIPIREGHVEALRADLGRHIILSSALGPLCDAAGIEGSLDGDAAVALLDPILLASPDEVNAFLHDIRWYRNLLVAHGADIDLLESGRVLDSLAAATVGTDPRRAQEYDANTRRAARGVVLSPLDAAILRFTGQYLHGSTIPHRDPEAVDPALLPAVLHVIGTAERASAGLPIERDARRGRTGTDKADWRRMEGAVADALRAAHPELAVDAVATVQFLMCAEAAQHARQGAFDPDGAVPSHAAALTFTDDNGALEKWTSADESAVEAFWDFVAQRMGSRNDVFTLEDETRGDGIQLHFSASSLARVETVSGRSGEPEYRVEYGFVDDLAHYRAMVRGYVAGGFAALDDLTTWTADHDEFEGERRRRRDVERSAQGE